MLQQPLIDYEAYANYRKGVAQALFADETFRGKSQELLVRVLTYYTQALFAEDQIQIAQARKKALDEQFQQNTQLFRQGEGTRTDILEAESRYELATAEEIEAQDTQDAALRELGALIGVPTVAVTDLAPLSQGFESFPLEPSSFATWHELAHYEVERNRAGHLPKLNAYASLRKSESDSGNTYNQRYDTNTVGFEVSVPLFAGGGRSSDLLPQGTGLGRVAGALDPAKHPRRRAGQPRPAQRPAAALQYPAGPGTGALRLSDGLDPLPAVAADVPQCLTLFRAFSTSSTTERQYHGCL